MIQVRPDPNGGARGVPDRGYEACNVGRSWVAENTLSRQLDHTNVATDRMVIQLGEYSLLTCPLDRGVKELVQGYLHREWLCVVVNSCSMLPKRKQEGYSSALSRSWAKNAGYLRLASSSR